MQCDLTQIPKSMVELYCSKIGRKGDVEGAHGQTIFSSGCEPFTKNNLLRFVHEQTLLPANSEWCLSEDVDELEAEIERLRAEIERLNKLLSKDLMYWESGREEDNASEEPWEIADRVADEYLGPGEDQVVEVQVAARLPDRKMRVWRDANGDMKWEWVE